MFSSVSVPNDDPALLLTSAVETSVSADSADIHISSTDSCSEMNSSEEVEDRTRKSAESDHPGVEVPRLGINSTPFVARVQDYQSSPERRIETLPAAQCGVLRTVTPQQLWAHDRDLAHGISNSAAREISWQPLKETHQDPQRQEIVPADRQAVHTPVQETWFPPGYEVEVYPHHPIYHAPSPYLHSEPMMRGHPRFPDCNSMFRSRQPIRPHYYMDTSYGPPQYFVPIRSSSRPGLMVQHPAYLVQHPSSCNSRNLHTACLDPEDSVSAMNSRTELAPFHYQGHSLGPGSLSGSQEGWVDSSAPLWDWRHSDESGLPLQTSFTSAVSDYERTSSGEPLFTSEGAKPRSYFPLRQRTYFDQLPSDVPGDDKRIRRELPGTQADIWPHSALDTRESLTNYPHPSMSAERFNMTPVVVDHRFSNGPSSGGAGDSTPAEEKNKNSIAHSIGIGRLYKGFCCGIR